MLRTSKPAPTPVYLCKSVFEPTTPSPSPALLLFCRGKFIKKKQKKLLTSNSQICDFPLLVNRWNNRISEAIIDVISVFCNKLVTPFLAWL